MAHTLMNASYLRYMTTGSLLCRNRLIGAFQTEPRRTNSYRAVKILNLLRHHLLIWLCPTKGKEISSDCSPNTYILSFDQEKVAVHAEEFPYWTTFICIFKQFGEESKLLREREIPSSTSLLRQSNWLFSFLSQFFSGITFGLSLKHCGGHISTLPSGLK